MVIIRARTFQVAGRVDFSFSNTDLPPVFRRPVHNAKMSVILSQDLRRACGNVTYEHVP